MIPLRSFVWSIITKGNFLQILEFINKNSLRIIYYHRVIKEKDLELIKIKNMGTHAKQFKKQMDYLKDHFYIASEEEIIESCYKDKKLPENSVWITFDDGYKDNYELAYPILKDRGMHATFFITSGYINKSILPCEDYIPLAVNTTKEEEIKFKINNKSINLELYDSESKKLAIKELWSILDENLLPKNEYLKLLISIFNIKTEDLTGLFMNWEDIKDLSQNGYSIGTHTVNHEKMSTLSASQLQDEISISKNEIEKHLKRKVNSFAYPFGKKSEFNKLSIDIVKKEDHKFAVTTIGGTNKNLQLNNLFTLKRFGISYEDSIEIFKFKVYSGSFWQ